MFLFVVFGLVCCMYIYFVMCIYFGFGFLILGFMVMVLGMVWVVLVFCMDVMGSCEVDNVFEDSIFCECVDGFVGGGGGGNI